MNLKLQLQFFIHNLKLQHQTNQINQLLSLSLSLLKVDGCRDFPSLPRP